MNIGINSNAVKKRISNTSQNRSTSSRAVARLVVHKRLKWALSAAQTQNRAEEGTGCWALSLSPALASVRSTWLDCRAPLEMTLHLLRYLETRPKQRQRLRLGQEARKCSCCCCCCYCCSYVEITIPVAGKTCFVPRRCCAAHEEAKELASWNLLRVYVYVCVSGAERHLV